MKIDHAKSNPNIEHNNKIIRKLSLWKRNFEKEKSDYIRQIHSFFQNQINSPKNNPSHHKLFLFNQFPPDFVQKIKNSIHQSEKFLLSLQQNGQYWNAHVISNPGLGAQFLLLKYFLGLPSHSQNDQKIINHILKQKIPSGGWNIYHGGPIHLSYSILIYLTLKLYGYSQKLLFMQKAKNSILKHGGIMKANVECRFWLSIFNQYSWNGLPPIPVQFILLPNNFVSSIYDIAYWCRTSLIPMSIIYNKKYSVPLPKNISVSELYCENIDKDKIYFNGEAKLLSLENILLQISRAIKLLEKSSPQVLDKIAIKKAKYWLLHHQSDLGDWGGIYPAVQYSIMALKVLGYSNDSPVIQKALNALMTDYCIPLNKDEISIAACTSPVWDTAWTVYSFNILNRHSDKNQIKKAIEWLYNQQIDTEGDWSVRNPNVLPGGWCFQFCNDFYPDNDDSAVVLMALLKNCSEPQYREAFKIGMLWLLSMQNNDGGWAAFERNVNKEFMNDLPLNDIKNFLDESTSDVTGRVLELLGKVGFTLNHSIVQRAVKFLESEQMSFGPWFGRWGVNYIYGTWSVLKGLESVGYNMKSPCVQRAIDWLKKCQNPDGGWGESCKSYDHIKYAGVGKTTPSQTSWALLALMASNEEYHSSHIIKGIQFLIQNQKSNGSWNQIEYTGTGFQKAFYLRYSYYPYYFPLIALSQFYQNVN